MYLNLATTIFNWSDSKMNKRGVIVENDSISVGKTK